MFFCLFSKIIQRVFFGLGCQISSKKKSQCLGYPLSPSFSLSYIFFLRFYPSLWSPTFVLHEKFSYFSIITKIAIFLVFWELIYHEKMQCQGHSPSSPPLSLYLQYFFSPFQTLRGIKKMKKKRMKKSLVS